jgi:hypothetical protein
MRSASKILRAQKLGKFHTISAADNHAEAGRVKSHPVLLQRIRNVRVLFFDRNVHRGQAAAHTGKILGKRESVHGMYGFVRRR